jgi:hypothetical protein
MLQHFAEQVRLSLDAPEDRPGQEGVPAAKLQRHRILPSRRSATPRIAAAARKSLTQRKDAAPIRRHHPAPDRLREIKEPALRLAIGSGTGRRRPR